MKRVLAVIMLFLLAVINFSIVPCHAQKDLIGQRAPDFEIKDIKGEKIKLSDFQGKIVILNFFATWCPPCRQEMPDFNVIQKENPDTVKIIAINASSENINQISNFAAQHKIEFTICKDDGKVGFMYGPIRAIPVTFVIDKEMIVKKHYVGSRPKNVFDNDIESLK